MSRGSSGHSVDKPSRAPDAPATDAARAALSRAWRQHAALDASAERHRRHFFRVRCAALVGQVLSTAFLLLRPTLAALVTRTELPGAHPFVNAAFGFLARWLQDLLGPAGPDPSPALWTLDRGLYFVASFIPLLIGFTVRAADLFTPWRKRNLDRASAEAILGQIYAYRCHVGPYSDEETSRLKARVGAIAARRERLASSAARTGVLAQLKVSARAELEKGELSRQARTGISDLEKGFRALAPAAKGQRQETLAQKTQDEDRGGKAVQLPPEMWGTARDDDGLSRLTPDRYVRVRLDDQINYYTGETVRLEKEYKRFQWLIFVSGALGTLLAAVGLDLWIAFTVALSVALTTWLEARQTQSVLVHANQTLTDLMNVREWWGALLPLEKVDPQNVREWWDALSPLEKVDPRNARRLRTFAENVRNLVTVTEKLLRTAHLGWVYEMQDALAEAHLRRPRILVKCPAADHPLCRPLVRRMGKHRVVLDQQVREDELYRDLVQALDDTVGPSRVLIVVIGPQEWSIADDRGAQRLDRSQGWVWLDIAAALDQYVWICPVPVEDADLSDPQALADKVDDVARRVQALEEALYTGA